MKGRNEAERYEFDISEVNTCYWRNHRNSIGFFLKTTACFVGARKGRLLRVEEYVPHPEISKGCHLKRLALYQTKAGRIAKLVWIDWKNIRVRGWRDSFKALGHNLIESIFSLLGKSCTTDGISNLMKYSIMFLQGLKHFVGLIAWHWRST